MPLRQTIWNKLAVEWRPDRVHDQVRTIDFDELPTHFDAYLKGMVRGRTVVRIGAGYASVTRHRASRGRASRSTRVARGRHDMQRIASSTAARSTTARRSGARRRSSIDWHTPFTRVLDYCRPPFARWFVGGRTNLCHNAVDRHLAARGDQPALVYISTETGETRRYTYRELARRGESLRGGAARRWASARAIAC